MENYDSELQQIFYCNIKYCLRVILGKYKSVTTLVEG